MPLKRKDISTFTSFIPILQAKAAEILEQNKNIHKSYNMYTIKLDKNRTKGLTFFNCFYRRAQKTKRQVVKFTISNSNKNPKQAFIGIEDTYSKGGEYEYLLQKIRLTGEAIANKIKELDKNYLCSTIEQFNKNL